MTPETTEKYSPMTKTIPEILEAIRNAKYVIQYFSDERDIWMDIALSPFTSMAGAIVDLNAFKKRNPLSKERIVKRVILESVCQLPSEGQPNDAG